MQIVNLPVKRVARIISIETKYFNAGCGEIVERC